MPENYNPYVVDTVLTVSSADAERAAREVLFYDGIPACSSAGATLCAATQLMGTGKCNRPLCIFCRTPHLRMIQIGQAARLPPLKNGAGCAAFLFYVRCERLC